MYSILEIDIYSNEADLQSSSTITNELQIEETYVSQGVTLLHADSMIHPAFA